MSILQTELKKYAAASRPEDDASLSGGARDAACTLDVTQMAADDVLRAVSDAAGDTTQTLTITGRNAAGEIVTDPIALNGVTPVAGAVTFERVIKAVLSAACAGNVTLERNTGPNDDVVIIPAGMTDATALFIGAASEAAQTVRYEKEFWRNESAESLTLNDAKIQLTADPSASVKIGVATAKDDTVSVANRLTAPGGVTFFDDAVEVNVPGNALALNESIGVWIELTRDAGAASLKSSYTTQLAGTSI
ncbi:MAG: hypothetical protein OEY11_15050 [Gammaproteobacteria bacterium]|nr:hypothetical protein [Gammaproteobacteria bacterium]